MRRVETLFLPQEGIDPIWREEIERSVGPRHNLSIFDGNEKRQYNHSLQRMPEPGKEAHQWPR